MPQDDPHRRDLVLVRDERLPKADEHMDSSKLTIKSQEAVAAAQELRAPARQPRALSRAPAARAARPGAAARARPGRRTRCAPQAEAALAQKPRIEGSQQQPGASAACSKVLDRAFDEAKRIEDDYVSTEHLLLALDVVPRDAAAREDRRGARRPARHLAGSRGHLPGAREVRPRPDRGGRERQARSGDRPRRGDPPRDPGALAPHEEQPGADRRARRRQDGDRRGARAADRRRRRPRGR